MTLLPGGQVVKAVDTYYQLVAQKNYERSETISAIENRYRQELMKAEAEYEASKAKKASWRLNGFYGIVGGIVLVATVALILVLLSIQRYVKQIDGKLASTAATSPRS